MEMNAVFGNKKILVLARTLTKIFKGKNLELVKIRFAITPAIEDTPKNLKKFLVFFMNNAASSFSVTSLIMRKFPCETLGT